jgi:multidrug efflux pump subunit AcrA (membrane-fusion protein)
VTRGDVTESRSLSVRYRPARQEVLNFKVGGQYIRAVYVEVGDYVYEGDIIAELDRVNITNQIQETLLDISRIGLNLEQLAARHNLNILEADVTGRPVDDGLYSAERDSLAAQLGQLQLRLAYLQEEDEKLVLRATMDGTVTYAMVFEVGDTSNERDRVAVISDQSNFVFEVVGLSSEFYDPDEIYEIFVDWEPYQAKLVDPNEMGIVYVDDGRTVWMALIGENIPVFGTNSYATFRYVMDEAIDVIRIPFNAHRTAGERHFVFVPVDGLRTIKDIEIGLRGIGFVEVISGLEEGDIVYVD